MRTIVAGRCGERRINGFACCFVWAWDRDRACAGDDGVPVVFVSVGRRRPLGYVPFDRPAARVFALVRFGSFGSRPTLV
jgi:hypothetical protein